MAGGFGKRLDPFTRVLPKPLIPIGDKTIVECIIDEFRKYQINSFYLSVNYKSKIIKSYFEELKPKYKINYVDEDKPLGTAGSLRFIKNKIKSTFFLTNCDTIIKDDYFKMLKFHKKHKYDITIISSRKSYVIPFGICELKPNASLFKIEEKPSYVFLVNTGMYIVEQKCLKLIPENRVFHFTQLIENVIKNGGNVGVFPIKSKSWLDVGGWEEYKNTCDILNIKNI